MDSGSDSYSVSAAFSYVAVPSSVVALHKFRAATHASESSPLEPPEPDFKTYILVEDPRAGGGGRSMFAQPRLKSGMIANALLRLNSASNPPLSNLRRGLTKAFSTATLISPTTVAPSPVLHPPPLSSPPSSSSLGTSPSPKPLPAFLAAAPSDNKSSSSRLPLVVALGAYFHQSPLVVARSLANVSLPEFLLGGGGSQRRKTAPTTVTPGGKGPAGQQQTQTPFDSYSEDDDFKPQEIGRPPSSGVSDEDHLSSERQLLYYKKLRETTGVAVVAELICRLVVVVGAKGDVLMFFESVEEQALDERSLERVSKKRRGMVQRGFKVVSGRETGCLIMVRNDGKKGRRWGGSTRTG